MKEEAMIEYVVRINNETHIVCERYIDGDGFEISSVAPTGRTQGHLEAALELMVLAAERHYNGNLPWIAADSARDQWLLRTGQVDPTPVLQRGDMVWL